MTMERRGYVERVLIVMNSDGSLRGAHQERIEGIFENGALVDGTLRQTPAEAVEPAALSALLPAQGALVAQVRSLLNDVTNERALKAMALEARDQARAELATAQATIKSRDKSLADQAAAFEAQRIADNRKALAREAALQEQLAALQNGGGK